MKQIRNSIQTKSAPNVEHFYICDSIVVRHVDLSWNTLQPSMVLMHGRLTDPGLAYYNGEVHIIEPETEKSDFHETS